VLYKRDPETKFINYEIYVASYQSNIYVCRMARVLFMLFVVVCVYWYLSFCPVLCLYTFLVQCCVFRYDFRIKTMFSLNPHLFVGGFVSYLYYSCLFVQRGVQHVYMSGGPCYATF